MPEPTFERLDDPSAYLDLARELASKLEPFYQRAAADRAYYAAFLFSRDQLAKKGYYTPYNSIDDHRYVPECLRQAVGTLGNDENRLRTARNSATYDTRDVLGSHSLTWMIKTAERIIEAVTNLPPK